MLYKIESYYEIDFFKSLLNKHKFVDHLANWLNVERYKAKYFFSQNVCYKP